MPVAKITEEHCIKMFHLHLGDKCLKYHFFLFLVDDDWPDVDQLKQQQQQQPPKRPLVPIQGYQERSQPQLSSRYRGGHNGSEEARSASASQGHCSVRSRS